MWRCSGNILCRHPSLSRGGVESLTIHRHIGGEDKAILVVSRDADLTLSEWNIACTINNIDLLTIGD